MRKTRSAIHALLSAFLLAGCEAAQAPDTPQVREMTIEEARAWTGDVHVAVTGIVTVPSGAFASSLSTGFAIQDQTAGIYVLDTQHTFELGDRVRVTGRRSTEFEQQTIRLQSATKLPGSGAVVPLPIRTGQFREAEEGLLIQTTGRIERVLGDAPYGYKIFINDGSGELQVFIDASTELIGDVTVWKPGDSVHVTGFAGRYEKTRALMPRVWSDMRKTAVN